MRSKHTVDKRYICTFCEHDFVDSTLPKYQLPGGTELNLLTPTDCNAPHPILHLLFAGLLAIFC